METYHPYHLVLNNVGIAFDSVTPDKRLEAFKESAGFSTVATASGAKSVMPLIKGTTRDVKTLIDTVGLDGLALTGSGTSTAILWMAKAGHGTKYASGSVHRKHTITKGLVVIESITASKGNSPAQASFAVYAVWDGTNDPLKTETSQALPNTPSRLIDLYVAGKCSEDGTDVETQGWTLNLGPDVALQMKDGDIYPTLVYVRKRDITAQVETLDLVEWTDGEVEDFVLYLRKVAALGSVRVDDATEEHISFTIASGYRYCGQVSASHPGEASVSVTVVAVFDGTNAAVVVDTTAAIA